MCERKVDELSELVVSIDQELSDFFSRDLRSKDPLASYRLLVWWLHEFLDYCLAGDIDETRRQLIRFLGEGRFQELDDSSRLISERMKLLVPEATYFTASFWSPRTKRRSTLVRRIGPPESERDVLCAAYAFFALTHRGVGRSCFSSIQYLATKASRKAGIRLSYEPGAVTTDEQTWLHTPLDVHEQILSETGFRKAIAVTLDQQPVGTLREGLRDLLTNKCGHFSEEPYRSFTDTAFRLFAERSSGGVVPEYAERVRRFCASRLNSDVDGDTAAFMLATNVLYNRCCPATYVYCFPVLVADTCCTMTIGTNSRLSDLQEIVVARAVDRLFTQTLLWEYSMGGILIGESSMSHSLTHSLSSCMDSLLSHDAAIRKYKEEKTLPPLPSAISQFEFPVELYALAIKSALRSKGDDQSFERSVPHVPSFERLLDEGLSAALVELIATQIGYKFAEYRLQLANIFAFNLRPPVTYVGDTIPPSVHGLDNVRQRSLFISALILAIQEAIQHTMRLMLAAPTDSRDGDRRKWEVTVTGCCSSSTVYLEVSNPVSDNATPSVLDGGNQERELELLSKGLVGWEVKPATVKGGQWRRRFERRMSGGAFHD